MRRHLISALGSFDIFYDRENSLRRDFKKSINFDSYARVQYCTLIIFAISETVVINTSAD
jgi:hypothetical protein